VVFKRLQNCIEKCRVIKEESAGPQKGVEFLAQIGDFKSMKGVVYTTKVTANSLKKEQTAKVLEIWIEDIQICINERNECFRAPVPRMAFNHFGTLEVPNEFCSSLVDLVNSREFFESSNKKLFSALLKRFSF